MAPAYEQHPAVTEAPPGVPVLPLAVYVDGVPFLKKESLIGVYLHNMTSGRRHLVTALRKSYMCKCGCKGWCTLFPVFQFMNWSLRACRAGVHPAAKWNGESWASSDGFRSWSAGQPLSARSALVHIKGDWAEYAHTLGFPTWSSVRYPCPFCK
eukprot:6169053-Alexandrium_andersonii.AAC.1